MAIHASGAFEVKLAPQTLSDTGADALLGRLSIDKTFHGDLTATSKGEMLSAGTSIKGSAGYVAIEKVSGSLHGRTGTFVLMHFGILNRGESHLNITVVPDSGTEALEGLSGTMNIINDAGKHSYTFDYTLP